MPVARRAANGNGFTLIEMLVSLALLGLMSAMLLAMVEQFGAFSARTAASDTNLLEIEGAQRILRDRLGGLRAVQLSASATPAVDLYGDRGMLTIVGPPPPGRGPDSLWRYRIMVSPAGDLLLSSVNSLDNRYNFALREAAGWRSSVLLRGVLAFSIDYFGPAQFGAGSAWQSDWVLRPQPPALIRLRVAFRPGDRRFWPDLIVRPRATENTACAIDPLTGRCREAA